MMSAHYSAKQNQITEGVIWKQLLLFFFPILLGSFFQQFYNTIDMVVVGRFVGTGALASVGGSAGQIVQLVVNAFTGLSAGAGVIISQFYGAKDLRNLDKSIHTAYAFSIFGSIFFMIAGILASPALLRLMKTPEELLPDSEAYLRIYFAGILFVFVYNIGSAILRATGDSKSPLYYLIFCCLLNVILDVVMVAGLQLGVSGVAIATVLAQAFSAILITLRLMHSKDCYRLSLRHIRFHGSVLRSQLYVGLPGGFQSVMYNLSNLIIQASINVYGTDTAAAWGSFGKLDAIFWMISNAFGVSITTFVGQNYGAGRSDRIRKGVRVCLLMDFGVSVLLAAFLILLRVPLFSIFTTDSNVIEIGAHMLFLITPYYITFIFIEVFSSALRGVSDVIIPTILTLFGICVFRMVWIFLAVPLHPTIEMVIFSYPITWITTSVLFIIYYNVRKKKL